MKKIYFAILLLIMAFPMKSALADCITPEGVAGDQMFNETYLVMQYCDGSDWISMGGKFSGAGSWVLNGGNLYYTSGNVGIGTSTPSTALEVKGIITAGNVIRLANETMETSCTAAGEIRYNTIDKGVQVCDGSAWQSAGISKFIEVGAVLYVGADQKIARDVTNFAWDVANSALTVGKKITFKSITGNPPIGDKSATQKLSDLSDVNVTGAADGYSLVYNGSAWAAKSMRTLNDLTDVDLSGLASGNILLYDGTIWSNATSLPVGSGGTGLTSAPAAGSVIFSDGTKLASDNANLFWDDANKRLGIGNITPQEKIHSLGNLALGDASVTQSPRIDFVTTTNHWNIDNYQGRFRIFTRPDYVTPGTEYMTITDTGNVGIGTVLPTLKLDVAGAVGITGRVYYKNADATPWWITPDGNGPSILLLKHGSLGGPTNRRGSLGWKDHLDNKYEYLTWTDAGNVGIGTTTPGAKLEVFNGTFGLRIGGTTTSWAGSATYPTIYSNTPEQWVMFTNPHISFVRAGVNGYTGTAMTGATLRFASNPAASTYWDVGIGHSGVGDDRFAVGRANSALLALTNAGVLSTAGGCSNCSDIRLKKDIVPIGSSLEKVKELKGYNFYWKAPEERDVIKSTDLDVKHQQTGLIAQEVEKVFPNLVVDGEHVNGVRTIGAEKVKNINYNGLFAPVIEAIKELASKSDAKDAEISTLKQENETMQGEIKSIRLELEKLRTEISR